MFCNKETSLPNSKMRVSLVFREKEKGGILSKGGQYIRERHSQTSLGDVDHRCGQVDVQHGRSFHLLPAMPVIWPCAPENGGQSFGKRLLEKFSRFDFTQMVNPASAASAVPLLLSAEEGGLIRAR